MKSATATVVKVNETRWPAWGTPLVVTAAFAVITIAESRRPLRARRESQARRMARNMATAAATALATLALQRPLLTPLLKRVEEEQSGLLPLLRLPPALRRALGVVLLDYTLWWWHFWNHRVRFLWRFHLVHHVDRDLDASTAIRFHFGEMSLSVLYRMAQVRLLGVDATTMRIWQMLLFISIFFHHSNLRLRAGVESALVRWIVTPRMHGIHHSDYLAETDSNWSSLFSWWDRAHGTMRLDIEQDEIEIGVAAYQQPEDVTLGKITALPFVEQRRDWIALDGTPHRSRPSRVAQRHESFQGE